MARKHAHPMDKIPLKGTADLGTLAANTAILFGTRTFLQDFVMKKLVGYIGLENPSVDDPGVVVGIHSGDLSQADVEQFLEITHQREGDIGGTEATKRPVQPLTAVSESPSSRWIDQRIYLPTFQEDLAVEFFAYNPGANAMVTGTTVMIQLLAFGRWL